MLVLERSHEDGGRLLVLVCPGIQHLHHFDTGPPSYRGRCVLDRPIVTTYIVYKFALPEIDPDFAFSLAEANNGEQHSPHVAECHAFIGVTVSAFHPEHHPWQYLLTQIDSVLGEEQLPSFHIDPAADGVIYVICVGIHQSQS